MSVRFRLLMGGAVLALGLAGGTGFGGGGSMEIEPADSPMVGLPQDRLAEGPAPPKKGRRVRPAARTSALRQ